MSRKKTFKNWLDRIYNTDEGEISCQELQENLPAYIEAEVVGHNPNGRYALVSQHLAQCPDCLELFEELLHLATLEANEGLPEVETLIAQIISGEGAAAGREEKEPIPVA